MTWQEAKKYLIDYNKAHNFTSKGTVDSYCIMHVVITEDSFNKSYSLEERTYVISNDNKAFIPGNLGYSIFSDSLDGSDRGVRLEGYLEEEGNPGGWKVEKVYIKRED